MSSKNLDFLPRSVKSSSNLRKVTSSMSKRPLNNTIKNQDIDRVKFKQILDWNSCKVIQKPETVNQLDNKYNVYKHGSPNYYSYSLESHKANNLKNDIQTLDLPFIDNVIKELNNHTQKQNNANMRDYDLYPNLMKKHQTHKFKQLLSDKQQLKDFLKWFETSFKMIEEKQIPLIKKFQQKQIIISAGFSQITQQVSHLSRPRSQILKMLWNKQTNEVEQIIQNVTSKTIQIERQNLLSLSKIHQEYQQQIDSLKKQNLYYAKQLKQANFVNIGYVNTLRCNRKTIRKNQILIKKLLDINQTTVQQNLNLLDENTKLTISLHLKNYIQQQLKNGSQHKKTLSLASKQQSFNSQQFIKQLPYAEARVLVYRRLQIASKKIQRQKQIKNIKKSTFQNLKKQSATEVKKKQFFSSQQQLDQKKQSIYKYLQQRLQQNPHEKLFLRQDAFHQDDHDLQTGQVDKILKTLINSKQLQVYLNNQNCQILPQLKQTGVNTSNCQENTFSLIKKQKFSQNKNQKNQFIVNKSLISILETTIQKDWQVEYQKNIRQSKLITRNSLLNLQIQKLKSFTLQKNQVSQVQEENQSDDDYIETQLPLRNSRMGKAQSSPAKQRFQDINFDELHQKLKKHITLAYNTCEKMPRNPQKYLNSMLKNIWQSILSKPIKDTHITKELCQYFRTNQNFTKNWQTKVFNFGKILKHFESLNQTCLIGSLILNISDKFKQYEHIIKQDITCIYFDLFKVLELSYLKNNEIKNVWYPCTNLTSIRGSKTQNILQKYFSRVKLLEINQKLEQLIKYSLSQKPETFNKDRYSRNDSLKSNIDQKRVTQLSLIQKQKQSAEIPLNPLVLYIIEIYLIQKEKYYASYSKFIDFFTEQNREDKIYSNQNQSFKMIPFNKWNLIQQIFTILSEKNSTLINLNKDYYLEDDFYRFGVLHDLPLLDQKLIQIQIQIKKLPIKLLQQLSIVGPKKIHQLNDNRLKWRNIWQILQKQCLVMRFKQEKQKQGFKSIINKLKTIVEHKQASQTFYMIYKLLIWLLYSKKYEKRCWQ